MRGSTQHIPGLVLTDHYFDLPLDHNQPKGETIAVYAREIVASGRKRNDLPWLVFLQGGPGYGSPRPMSNTGWLEVALKDYRVLLLDQRGTVRSSPVNARTLAQRGKPAEQADYLSLFRADSIVRDCEAIRAELLGPNGRWSVLGQSFGGFCTISYLSIAPHGLEKAFVTGGIPPIGVPLEDVYRRTFTQLREKNQLFFQRYPDDLELTQRIASVLASKDVRLPEGDRLTVSRFQQLGLHFGMSDGYEIVHYLLETAFDSGPPASELSYSFLHSFEHALPYCTNPIFSILHEAIYAGGTATDWAAERVRQEFPEFSPHIADRPILFTGEMIFPWMFEEYHQLRSVHAAAQILADRECWPPLYDVEQLARNEVPTFAAIYYDDMYVDRELSLQAAKQIANLRLWITNEYEHNGLRGQGKKVLGHLFEMARGEA